MGMPLSRAALLLALAVQASAARLSTFNWAQRYRPSAAAAAHVFLAPTAAAPGGARPKCAATG